MPRVRLVVVIFAAFTAASLERASTLEEWLGAMTLDPGVDFETTIAGTSLEITDLTCEDLKITGALAAAYAPRGVRATVAGVEASARQVRVELQHLRAEGLRRRARDRRPQGRGPGRPPRLRRRRRGAGGGAIGRAAASVALDGVKLRGDALGSLLDGFTDAIVGFYDEQIADAICAALAGAVSADLTGISPSCEAGAAPETPDAARALAETFDAAPAYVDWAHLLANRTGPARRSRAREPPRRGRRFEGGDLFGLLLDVGARLGLPLASEEALDLGGLSVATVGGAGPERARLAVSVADASRNDSVGRFSGRAARALDAFANAGDDGRDGGGGWERTFVQGLASPPLAYDLDANTTITNVAVDAAAAVAMTADATRAGVAAFELGGAADAACARAALRVSGARRRGVARLRGRGAGARRRGLRGLGRGAGRRAGGGAGGEVAPAARSSTAGSTGSRPAPRAPSPRTPRPRSRARSAARRPRQSRSQRLCERKSRGGPAAAAPAQIALDASGLLRSAADAAKGLQLAGPLRGFAESLAGGDGRVVLSRRGARVAIGPLRSAVAVSDVFLANAASIDDVRAFPRGADSLLDATTVELLSLRAGFGRGPVVGGATLTFDTPFGARPSRSTAPSRG
ncbi:oxidoreductase [Aureococcus anophagefferens]|nr:oxidoreductase [Aureococcus anophagefferens]